MREQKIGALFSYLNLAITNITGILITPYTIKMLGNNEYGLYSLIGAFVGYLSVLDLGLNNAIIRYVAKYKAEKDEYSLENFLAISLIIYFFIGLLLFLFGGLAYFNIDYIFSKSLSPLEIEKAKVMILILSFNLAVTLIGGAFTGICSGFEKFIYPRVITLLKVVLRTVVLVVILKYGAKSIGIVILDTIVNVLFIIATIWYSFTKLKIKIKLHKWDFLFVKEIFKYSFWIFLFALIFQFQWRSGQVVLGVTTNTFNVAVFSVGVMLGVYFNTIGNIINGLFLPKAVRSIVENVSNEVLMLHLIKIGRMSLFILLYILGAFVLTGKQFVLLWLGNDYIPAFWITLLIMIYSIIPITQGYTHSIIQAKGLMKFKTIVTLVLSVLGIIVGYFLARKNPIYGMIAGLIMCNTIALIIMNIYYKVNMKLQMSLYFKEVILMPLWKIILPILFCFFFIDYSKISWAYFIYINIGYTILFCVNLYVWILNSEEKRMILKLHKN